MEEVSRVLSEEVMTSREKDSIDSLLSSELRRYCFVLKALLKMV